MYVVDMSLFLFCVHQEREDPREGRSTKKGESYFCTALHNVLEKTLTQYWGQQHQDTQLLLYTI